MNGLRLGRELQALLFTLPAMVPLTVFWLFPIGYVFYLSLTSWDFMSEDKPFVGLDNYIALLQNPALYDSLKVTLLFVLGNVLPTLAGGLALAVLLNRKMRVGGAYRALLFSPWVTPTVAVSIVWSWIFEPEAGLANAVLRLFGAEGVGWLSDPDWALVGILLVTIWKGIGWAMVFYLVALRNVPGDILEAASIDGAGASRKFWQITLPLISPTTFFLTVVLVISSLQAYDQINIMTQGGPAGSTRTLLYLYYQSAFEAFNIGEASAVAVTLVAGCALLSLVSFTLSRKSVHY
ncbi:carbohydrate ABC transporter permease [Paenibacillus harenae]|uniref:Multiple sugar transport system permease protein n=1 Tax=Paenibacillus harenae TaxID=306543 RepID=A0ABT9U9P9_PAEHA|nr:sugar ABC transporter permease [Paenibacillus harenae]MDQ0063924.1 multiple sugar transport system permease protein [Paenibacillus harenae]MDQ0116376.1 multiple sugar transport system permease protein [Paenibacillus harenae]